MGMGGGQGRRNAGARKQGATVSKCGGSSLNLNVNHRNNGGRLW
jgi:hypothetical protein